MSKSLKKAFILVFMLSIFIFTSCNDKKNNELPEKKPSDFSFILDYGINAKNQLDTEEGTYTKDMVAEPSVMTNLKLSDEEMNEIYSIMRDIDILSYSEDFNPISNAVQTPFETYTIKIIADGKEKYIYWKDEKASKIEEAVKLRDLFKRIHEIISTKEEYKKLPTPQGGYD